jgi:biotin-dependent carboxylase-like uncharacterized protein
MSGASLRVIKPGVGITVQDSGRPGWKRWGVPPGGAMDPHAATWANRLTGNSNDAPVLELLLQGAEFEALSDCWVGVAGADAGSSIQPWSGGLLRRGERLAFPLNRTGLWTYVAIEGGIEAPRVLGSASTYARAGFGLAPVEGTEIEAADGVIPRPRGLSRSWVALEERRDYDEPPFIRIWRGPQWSWFEEEEWDVFLGAEWRVSTRSDRTGFRLEGARVNPPEGEMMSEPVLVGSIQIPPNGQPIVTMRDGPTVGGYPKIGVVEPASLPWLAQCRPGTPFRFEFVE